MQPLAISGVYSINSCVLQLAGVGHFLLQQLQLDDEPGCDHSGHPAPRYLLDLFVQQQAHARVRHPEVNATGHGDDAQHGLPAVQGVRH